MTPLLLASLVRSQVNQEIYSETDLLAIDSEIQEVREPGPASFAVLPPPGFQEPSQSSAAPAAGIPDRWFDGGAFRNVFTGPGDVEQKYNPADGSHSFRWVKLNKVRPVHSHSALANNL